MKTKYLGKNKETGKITLADRKDNLNKFFPIPAKIILSDADMRELEEKIADACRRYDSEGWSNRSMKIKRCFRNKLRLGTQSGRFGSRTIESIVGGSGDWLSYEP
jgi:hypothetical protein